MKLALLQCGNIPEKFHAATGGDSDVIFSSHFNQYAEGVTIEAYNVSDGIYPSSMDDHDGYILNGSRFSVYDDEEWVKQLKVYVSELHAVQKKFIGICFGHQMIAEALGGKVTKSPNGWGVGAHTFDVRVQESWMKPPMQQYTILMSCQDQVQTLPPDSTVLAGNDFCPVGMFRVGQHFLGMQGHPEFNIAFSKTLMDSRQDRIPADTIERGMQSLDSSISTQELTDWMVNFIRL